MQQRKLFFFIGTEAELIKLFPVMWQLTQKGVPYAIIASGQNDLKTSSVLQALNGGRVDLELSDEKTIRKTAAGLLAWYFSTWRSAKARLAAAFGADALRGGVMVVHGDTVSTMMGAYLGRSLGMKVAHVEAGLRSHNWLSPFPEEIDRVLTSHKATLHFAPGPEAVENLRKARVKGRVVDTEYNTIIDSLAYSRSVPCKNEAVQALQDGTPYFVFVMHRQENLVNKKLVEAMIARVTVQARTVRCVMILHKPTEVTLAQMGILEKLQSDPQFTLLPRVEYFDFMKLLDGAAFVITDGGSNQEELAYMGKPCLIMRDRTERSDGLGESARLYGGDLQAVDDFVRDYTRYRRPAVTPAQSPAACIADALCAATED